MAPNGMPSADARGVLTPAQAVIGAAGRNRNSHTEETPMAIFIQAELAGVTTAQYDALNAKLQALPGDTFKGCMSHVAIPTGSGMQIFDVWESEESMRKFSDLLMPAAQELGLPMGEMPKVSPVHDYWVPEA